MRKATEMEHQQKILVALRAVRAAHGQFDAFKRSTDALIDVCKNHLKTKDTLCVKNVQDFLTEIQGKDHNMMEIERKQLMGLQIPAADLAKAVTASKSLVEELKTGRKKAEVLKGMKDQ